MRHILSLAFTLSHSYFDDIIEFQAEKIRLTQYGTNFDVELTKRLIEQYDGHVDVMALSGLPPIIKFKGGEFIHPTSLELKHYAKETLIVDGQMLKDVYLPWAMRQFVLKNQPILSKKRIGIYSASFQVNLLEVLEEFQNQILMADPFYFLRLPFVLTSSEQLNLFMKVGGNLFRKMKLKRSQVADFSPKKHYPRALKNFLNCDIFVGAMNTINLMDLDHLKDKILIVDFATPEFEAKLRAHGVAKVVTCLPHFDVGPCINYAMFEALLQAKARRTAHLDQNDILNWIQQEQLGPELIELNSKSASAKTKFAFIIHPLNKKHLFYHPKLKWFIKNFPQVLEPLENTAEEIISMLPGIFYGRIHGVKSEKNGKEVEGLIYSATETPKKFMQKDPEVVYRRLVRLAEQASLAGAGIIGLGAYTKIVGDAGVTVARRSPIPVTTGNSLSAASTLWAAKVAVFKMGMVHEKDDVMQGECMVVGATGSIGAVSAKLLAQKWKKIILVAPRAYKLLELKAEIAKLAPHCEIHVATDPTPYLSACHLVITTTSSRGAKVLDIDAVRPGCVICDVSRPFDITEEEALRRPDVMVIASGEVELPGTVKITVYLGLHDNVVYACLAETALLAMEGKLESFTLSRNIDYEKVLEIDRLAHEHGVRLSHIMGHQGIISDEEFELCRSHAFEALSKNSGTIKP
ncbi:MAG: hypothetical protein AABY86_13880 [Bdellovibrionota bacterium]